VKGADAGLRLVAAALLLAALHVLGRPGGQVRNFSVARDDASLDIRLNINGAGVRELAALPAVGPVIAARIVERRRAAGGFKSMQDLLGVRGIGAVTLDRISGYSSLGREEIFSGNGE
jgi:competence ComEA-like helix-hairpin-helix protein